MHRASIPSCGIEALCLFWKNGGLFPSRGLFGDYAVVQRTLFKTTLFDLNAEVEHTRGRCAAQRAVAVRGNPHDRALGDGEGGIVDLEVARAAQHDVDLFVLFVAVEEGHGLSRIERAERDFATGGPDTIFHELFPGKGAQVAYRGVGEFFARVDFTNSFHIL